MTPDRFELLASLGLAVFPIKPNRKDPAVKWKHYQDNPSTLAERVAWDRSTYNTGIVTGAASNIVVLDLDNADAWCDAMARGLPDTLWQKTPRGWHYIFQHPGGSIQNRAGFLDGMDIRGDGGYVVGHGSYFVPNDAERADGKVEGAYELGPVAPIAPLPEWLLPYLIREAPRPPVATGSFEYRGETAYGRKALQSEIADLLDAQPGHRNDQLNKAAFAIGSLVAGGWADEDEALSHLEDAARQIGLDDEEISKTIGSGFTSGQASPRVVPEQTAEAFYGTRDPLEQGEAPLPPGIAPAKPFGPVVRKKMVYGGMMPSYFAGCVYVVKNDAMFIPEGVLLKKSGFDGVYGGPAFYFSELDKDKTRSAWEAFRLNSVVPLPKVFGTCFRPECAPGSVLTLEGLPYLNAYVPVNVPRMQGDATPFLQHVRRMLPAGNDAELLLHWMASCVQNPGAKFQWWPVVQGVKGNGKTLLLMCMMNAVGTRYSHLVNPTAMARTGNQFNSWIENKLFLGFEEIYTSESRRDTVELLKSTVTNQRIASEAKGRDQDTVDNRANGMCLTNHVDGVPIDEDERRFGIFWCAQQAEADLARDGMGGGYFPDLYRWLNDSGYAIVTDFLHTMPLRAEMDPAQLMHRAPVTSSTGAAVEASRGRLEQEILEAIEQDLHGFGQGVVSSVALSGLFQRLHVNIGPRKYRQIMQTLGYDWHPGLKDGGRPNNPMADGTKPRLYFRRGHAVLALSEPSEIIAAVESARSGTPPSANVIPFKR